MRETVILIHGTFASRKPGSLQWYEPDHPFCRELDEHLKRSGSSARCWAHCDEANIFGWSGENSWAAREDAAEALTRLIKGIASKGWTCHIVAHSHGGNIAIEAIRRVTHFVSTNKIGFSVTLGTPIIETPLSQPFDTISHGLDAQVFQISRADLVLTIVSGIFCFIFGWSWVYSQLGSSWKLLAKSRGLLTLELVGMAIAALVRLGGPSSTDTSSSRPDSRRDYALDRLLMLHSVRDEAIQLLSTLTAAGAPIKNEASEQPTTRWAFRVSASLREMVSLAFRLDRVRYPGAYWRTSGLLVASIVFFLAFSTRLSHVHRSSVLDLFGLFSSLTLAYTFVLAATWRVPWNSSANQHKLLDPVLVPARVGRFLITLFQSATTQVVQMFIRSNIRDYITSSALGLGGLPFRATHVGFRPSLTAMPTQYYKVEVLPDDVETASALARDQSMTALFGALMNSLSRTPLSIDDVHKTLSGFAKDGQLIHAMYYSNPWCLEKISSWIAQSIDDRMGLEHSTMIDRMQEDVPLYG